MIPPSALRGLCALLVCAPLAVACSSSDGGDLLPGLDGGGDAGGDGGAVGDAGDPGPADGGADAGGPGDGGGALDDGGMTTTDGGEVLDGGDTDGGGLPAGAHAEVTPITGDQRGVVSLAYRLFDPESDALRVTVEFSVDDGVSFRAATAARDSEGLAMLASSPDGVAHSFRWNSVVDLGKRPEPRILLRVTPHDAARGTPDTAGPFSVNNTPQFVLADAGSFPAIEGTPTAVAAGDVDHDGDIDLVVGTDGEELLLLNDGTGFFFAFPGAFGSARGQTTSVILVDLTGDGRPEVLFAEAGSGAGAPERVYENDGFGTFTDATATWLPANPPSDVTASMLAGDLDGDRRPDLVILNGGGAPNRLLLNTGAAFVEAPEGALPADSGFTPAAGGALVDVDGDRDLDLVYAFTAPTVGVRLVQNDWDAMENGMRFSETSGRVPSVTAGRPVACLAGDLDGNRRPDIVILLDSAVSRTFLNAGDGRFVIVNQFPSPPRALTVRAATLVDHDLDGDLDLFVATRSPDADVLLRNSGSGTFVDPRQLADTTMRDAGAVTAADVDGDGDPDFVVLNRDGASVVWLSR